MTFKRDNPGCDCCYVCNCCSPISGDWLTSGDPIEIEVGDLVDVLYPGACYTPTGTNQEPYPGKCKWCSSDGSGRPRNFATCLADHDEFVSAFGVLDCDLSGGGNGVFRLWVSSADIYGNTNEGYYEYEIENGDCSLPMTFALISSTGTPPICVGGTTWPATLILREV